LEDSPLEKLSMIIKGTKNRNKQLRKLVSRIKQNGLLEKAKSVLSLVEPLLWIG